jgi:hypothetical protein
MSFGASPSDIIIVVTFCRALYRKCRDAGGEYDEISREVRGEFTCVHCLSTLYNMYLRLVQLILILNFISISLML